MPEYFLVSSDGHILNIVTSDTMTQERAEYIFRELGDIEHGEQVTPVVTRSQLEEYERPNDGS